MEMQFILLVVLTLLDFLLVLRVYPKPHLIPLKRVLSFMCIVVLSFLAVLIRPPEQCGNP